MARLVLALLVAAALASCGGDGGSGEGPERGASGDRRAGEAGAYGSPGTGTEQATGTTEEGSSSENGGSADSENGGSADSENGGSGRGGSAEAGAADRNGGGGAGGGSDSPRGERGGSGDSEPRAGAPRRRSGPLTPEGKRDIEAAKRALRAFVRALDAHDPGLCTELVTARYRREVTGRRGDAAIRQCRRDVVSDTSSVRLSEIEGVRVTGDTALVQFTSSVGSTTGRQILRLRRAERRWLIDGDGTRDAR